MTMDRNPVHKKGGAAPLTALVFNVERDLEGGGFVLTFGLAVMAVQVSVDAQAVRAMIDLLCKAVGSRAVHSAITLPEVHA